MREPITVRDLITELLKHDLDMMVGVCDRTSWDAADRLMTDPETNQEIALALAISRIGGCPHKVTNTLVDVRRVKDGDFGTLLVISGTDR